MEMKEEFFDINKIETLIDYGFSLDFLLSIPQDKKHIIWQMEKDFEQHFKLNSDTIIFPVVCVGGERDIDSSNGKKLCLKTKIEKTKNTIKPKEKEKEKETHKTSKREKQIKTRKSARQHSINN
jgi:hypothetical protein